MSRLDSRVIEMRFIDDMDWEMLRYPGQWSKMLFHPNPDRPTEPNAGILKFEPGAVIVETARPDSFYARLTELAASGEAGPIDEVQSPDDNLQAVFKYLVKQ